MNIVINLNKPQDVSSQQAARKVKQLLAARKAGHAGTLDPIATGVLLVCLNEATKITRFLSDLDKEYVVRMKLGERTDTYDATGKVIEKADYQTVTEADIRRILTNFTGLIKQTPPMYSAVKIGGRPALQTRQERDCHKQTRENCNYRQNRLFITEQAIRRSEDSVLERYLYQDTL